MKLLLESARLPSELGGWALRGGLCAATSVFWACVAGFTDPQEIAGMAAGVAVWVTLFAGYCVWHAQAPRPGMERFGPALKAAAWIKCALAAAGWVTFALCSLLQGIEGIIGAGFLFLLPDCLLGMAALHLVGAISGLGDDRLPRADSFGWTALTTMVDGAMFTLVIVTLAMGVLAWWRFAPRLLAWLRFSPTRSVG